jgi:hypothetical protein
MLGFPPAEKKIMMRIVFALAIAFALVAPATALDQHHLQQHDQLMKDVDDMMLEDKKADDVLSFVEDAEGAEKKMGAVAQRAATRATEQRDGLAGGLDKSLVGKGSSSSSSSKAGFF